MKSLMCLLILLSMPGCVANPQAVSSPFVAAQPVIRAEQIGCPSIFKPGMQGAMMVSMMDFYEGHEDKPYLMAIAENWTLTRTNIGYCKSGWEVGDLNADGRTDLLDFSIYAGVK